MLLAYLVVLCVTGKGGYVIKISNFHSKCKETTGPLKCHPKVSPSFFFATFFYPIFSKPFFGDFFGDFLLATFFPRYVLSDFFFWRLFVATSTEGSEHGTCGKMAISTSSSTGGYRVMPSA